MTSVILFVCGAIVGSFLNVWALRYNSGLSLGGRSSCARCSVPLRWYELVPIFSFVFLGGRCQHCRIRISRQYPLVEVATGILFVTVPLIFLPVFCLYVVITVYDLRHKIIPDPLVYAAIFLSLLVNLFNVSNLFNIFTLLNLLNLLAGPILFAFFGIVWLASRGRAMGFGDAKLALSIGLLLGAAAGFSAVILAFWVGAAWGMCAMIFSAKKFTIKSELPFAPFLIFGAWLASVWTLDILHVSTFFI